MAKEPQDKARDESRKDASSALRDALISKVKGGGGESEKDQPHPHHVTPHEIGSAAVEEESALARPFSFGGPGYLDRAIFCRQLATLIEVGIPVLKAMQMLAQRTANGKMRKAIAASAKGIEEGQSIYQAMAANTRTFSPLVVNIIRIGEMGGILEDSLVRLAEIMESKAKIKRQIVSASMYPMVALAVAVLVVGIIMIRAIPVFAEVYRASGNELPPLTQFVLGLSGFLQSAWWILIVLAVLAFWGLKMWGKTPGGARLYSWLALRIPVLRGVNQKIGVARSTRTLGGLVNAGIPLVESLGIAADTNENLLIADALRAVHHQVERGERMADPLTKSGIFPAIVVDMIAIGEETGTLDRMLNKVADIYDAEVDSTLNGLASIIEPLLIVVLGGVVIFIALAVLLPYFNLVNVV
jgi:type IV pilus assembly protein PilC